MPLELDKIDDCIKKLQELRRIAADAEMGKLLSEFLTADEPKIASDEAPAPPITPDQVNQLVESVLGVESPRPGPDWASRKS
jgi:hypothetical protein